MSGLAVVVWRSGAMRGGVRGLSSSLLDSLWSVSPIVGDGRFVVWCVVGEERGKWCALDL